MASPRSRGEVKQVVADLDRGLTGLLPQLKSRRHDLG
jgi:hypothetical protein